jgi:hypothetical protein
MWDAAFAVHPDFRSHKGAILTTGKGAIMSISRKQGMNTRSSTEAELVAADEVTGTMLWTKLFLEAQGYPVTRNTKRHHIREEWQEECKQAFSARKYTIVLCDGSGS